MVSASVREVNADMVVKVWGGESRQVYKSIAYIVATLPPEHTYIHHTFLEVSFSGGSGGAVPFWPYFLLAARLPLLWLGIRGSSGKWNPFCSNCGTAGAKCTSR